MRAQHLLLDPADWQHPPAQRDLSRHRDVIACRPPSEDRSHRRQHGHARRRTFFWLRARRHVHVNVVLVEERGIDPDVASARLQVRERRSRRLLHHITELPCEL